MNNLFDVLDSILSSERGHETLESLDEIIDHADFGCGMNISYTDAKLIQKVGKKWRDQRENGDGSWCQMRHDAMTAVIVNDRCTLTKLESGGGFAGLRYE